jgi:hypothetical protein
MLDHVEGKIIRAAEAPDRNAEQQHNPEFGMLYDEQGRGCQTRREKKDTFRFDPTGIREVFHILIAAALLKEMVERTRNSRIAARL